MAYDALIFDLDGTLWDTTRPVLAAWKQVAQTTQGLPAVSESQIHSVMGLPQTEAFEKLLGGIHPPLLEKAARDFEEREIALLANHYLYPGVAEGLELLAGSFPLYLVSNCGTAYLDCFLKVSGVGKFFQDADCFGTTKTPKGDTISLVMRRNKKSKGAYVGDTAGDQIAARQAGLDFYHARYGFGSPAQDCLGFDSFPQVRDFFLSLLKT
jgi:phosphoglycolate phosphatase